MTRNGEKILYLGSTFKTHIFNKTGVTITIPAWKNGGGNVDEKMNNRSRDKILNLGLFRLKG